MMLKSQLKVVNKLIKRIEAVRTLTNDSTISWETRYRLIFSGELSQKIRAGFDKLGLNFSYYDPDASYEEDVCAFMSAVTYQLKELEALKTTLEKMQEGASAF